MTSTLTLAPSAMTRRLRSARLGVIRSASLAGGAALGVFAYGTAEARAIAAHLLQLGYEAAATGDRVTVTLPEPVEDEPAAETADELVDRILAEHPTVARKVARSEERARHEDAARERAVEPAAPVARISTRAELIEGQVARGVTRERATMIADARDALQAELTRNAPAIARVLADEVTPEQVADAILDRRPILDLYGRPAELTREQAETVDAGVTLATERLAVLGGYGLPAARAQALRFAPSGSRGQFVYLGERFLGTVVQHGASWLLGGGEGAGSGEPVEYATREDASRALVESTVDDDPREQPAPLVWSEVAGS